MPAYKYLPPHQKHQTFLVLLLAFICFATLAGCGKDPDTATVVKEAPKTNKAAVTISGIVRSDTGVVGSGEVKVQDRSGKKVTTSQIDAKGKYAADIPVGTRYPLLLTAHPGKNEEQKDKLSVAVVEPLSTDHDLTTVSTQIAEKAKSLGGYTRKNMIQAAMKTAAMPDGDKTVGGFRGDPTKQFGGWH